MSSVERGPTNSFEAFVAIYGAIGTLSRHIRFEWTKCILEEEVPSSCYWVFRRWLPSAAAPTGSSTCIIS